MAEREYRWVRRGNKMVYTNCPEGPPKMAPAAQWPMVCCASGVHPSQAVELKQFLADRGCNTEVTAGGDPVYRSAAHRREALRLRGMHDNNSFF